MIDGGEDAAIPRVENVDVALLRVVGLEFTGDRDDVAVCACEEGLVGFVHYVKKHSTGADVVDDEVIVRLRGDAEEAFSFGVKVEVHGGADAAVGWQGPRFGDAVLVDLPQAERGTRSGEAVA